MARVGTGGVALLAAAALAMTTPAFAAPLPVARPIARDAAPVPLPPPRPEEDGPPMPPAAAAPVAAAVPIPPDRPPETAAPPVAPPAPPEPDTACPDLLAGGTVAASALPPIAEGACGIAAPVRLDAVVLRDGRRVPLVPSVTLRCDLAAALADWLRDDVVPATAAEGELLAVQDAAAYDCRSRNHRPGERLSEHARGNAVDILGLRFATRTISIADAAARPVWALVAPSACRRFATVLGPGSDADHATDLHLDLEHRRAGVHICQWDAS